VEAIAIEPPAIMVIPPSSATSPNPPSQSRIHTYSVKASLSVCHPPSTSQLSTITPFRTHVSSTRRPLLTSSPLISFPSFGGSSVTMPHKLEISKFCHTVTDHAQRIDTINILIPPTIRYQREGR